MDIIIDGNANAWKLITKAASVEWEKTTRAIEIPQVGCVVQVSTMDKNGTTKSLTFVPGVKLEENEMCDEMTYNLIAIY